MPGPVIYEATQELPPVLPLFPLPQALLLPRARLPLNIFEPRYLAMVDGALSGDRLIGMIQPKGDGAGDDRPSLFDVGCAGRIGQFSETPDGRYLITLSGVARFRISRELSVTTPYRQAEVSWAEFEDDLTPDDSELPFERDSLIDALRMYFSRFGQDLDWQAMSGAPAEALVGSLASICPFAAEEKQALLEAPTLKQRAGILISLVEMALVEDTGPADRDLQ